MPGRIGLVLAVLVAAVLSSGAAAQVAAPNDHLIVPWKRIGPAALGMTVAELVGVMGEPVSKWPGIVDVYNWHDVSVTVTKDSSWPTQICTLNPAYATAEGVHPGSTDESVDALLGRPKYSRIYRGWWRFTYTNLYWPGLMVSVHLKGFATNHLVWKICVNQFSGHAE